MPYSWWQNGGCLDSSVHSRPDLSKLMSFGAILRTQNTHASKYMEAMIEITEGLESSASYLFHVLCRKRTIEWFEGIHCSVQARSNISALPHQRCADCALAPSILYIYLEQPESHHLLSCVSFKLCTINHVLRLLCGRFPNGREVNL